MVRQGITSRSRLVAIACTCAIEGRDTNEHVQGWSGRVQRLSSAT